MSDHTAIEWTGATWNPVTGCDRISPGCAHCYARTMAKRMKAMGQPRYQRDGDGPGFGVTLHPDLLDPAKVRKLRPLDKPIFVCSMADLFHDDVPETFIGRVFATMVLCPERTFQVLTKRPERARDLLTRMYAGDPGEHVPLTVLPNVWLGVSIENARYTWRADVLREIPAAVRFISAEPLLGSLFTVKPRDPKLNFVPLALACGHLVQDVALFEAGGGKPTTVECPEGCGMVAFVSEPNRFEGQKLYLPAPLDLTGIDWVIVGGESGPGARPMHPDWARELRDACLCVFCRGGHDEEGCTICAEYPAFFLKQLGGIRDKRGGEAAVLDGRRWTEMPGGAT